MSSLIVNKIQNDAMVPNKQIDTNHKQARTQHIDKNYNSQEQVNKANNAKDISPKELKKIISKLNENVSMLNQNVKFAYNDTIKSLTVEVLDASTGKVIREIPPKEVINLQKKLSEVVGIIFDSKEVE